MNYNHLLEQADILIDLSPTGAPRQADLRRAISTTYYALFHFASAAMANLMVTKTTNLNLWVRTYRTLEHKDFLNRSKEARKATIGFAIDAFADAVTKLLEARLRADYDPTYR